MGRRSTTLTIGSAGERRALEYLQSRGLQLIQRNFRCRFGEVDLVMRDRDILVFVEVRTRRQNARVSAAESIDAHKQRRLAQAARMYLRVEPRVADWPVRFDVVTCEQATARIGNVEWIRDAFRPD